MTSRLVIGVFVLLDGLMVSDCLAQASERSSVISAARASVDVMLQERPDARERGTIALESHVLPAELGPAPPGWPTSLILTWVGHGRDAARAPDEMRLLVDQANGAVAGTPRWVGCGSSPGSEPCHASRFFAIVAVSEPWICGDQAQVLASIRYRSTDTLHPSSWQASVIRLSRVEGEWKAGEWYTHSTN